MKTPPAKHMEGDAANYQVGYKKLPPSIVLKRAYQAIPAAVVGRRLPYPADYATSF